MGKTHKKNMMSHERAVAIHCKLQCPGCQRRSPESLRHKYLLVKSGDLQNFCVFDGTAQKPAEIKRDKQHQKVKKRKALKMQCRDAFA